MDRRLQAFELLNQELAKEGLNLTLLCVGGYVLEYHGLRATHDVDAFYTSDRKICEIIFQVGQVFNLNYQGELWLNNDVATLNPEPPLDVCETLYSFSNLTILLAPIEYVLGMKMVSLREYDFKDIASIIKYKKLRSPINTYKKLKKLGFTNLDFSVLLEGFGSTYGFDWLSAYFTEHQDELKDFFW